MKETMPFLLTESLDHSRRELTLQHIESCAACAAEWAAYKDTWSFLGELPEVEVPARVRERFLAWSDPRARASAAEDGRRSTVVPFRKRVAVKWVAQAAAVAILAGGSYFAGHRTRRPQVPQHEAQVQSVYSLAENRVLPASELSPTIQGRPNIQNVKFADADPSGNKIGLTFDVTSRVTVTGSPNDRAMVRLLSYVLENENSNVAPSRSRAMEWVRQTYSDPQNAEPEIASAVAKVLRNDSHEGVRIRAAETLKSLPLNGAADTRQALIYALNNDPNPAVRIKAVEALGNIIRSGNQLDAAAVDTLRAKASQDGENMYVRVKAAEALSNIHPQ
ncbi:MAG TPA: HEAT repeat domain-containing protein [Thermoanaerobaculia bacterium]|nr:HEAT repeat domain-containing protein [Thermoanaerobaculia bacterium]